MRRKRSLLPVILGLILFALVIFYGVLILSYQQSLSDSMLSAHFEATTLYATLIQTVTP